MKKPQQKTEALLSPAPQAESSFALRWPHRRRVELRRARGVQRSELELRIEVQGSLELSAYVSLGLDVRGQQKYHNKTELFSERLVFENLAVDCLARLRGSAYCFQDAPRGPVVESPSRAHCGHAVFRTGDSESGFRVLMQLLSWVPRGTVIRCFLHMGTRCCRTASTSLSGLRKGYFDQGLLVIRKGYYKGCELQASVTVVCKGCYMVC